MIFYNNLFCLLGEHLGQQTVISRDSCKEQHKGPTIKHDSKCQLHVLKSDMQ